MKAGRSKRALPTEPTRIRRRPAVDHAAASEVAELRERLAEATQTLRAIRMGKVDAVVAAGRRGPQVFTLQGAEHAYRVLIESMNEGAVTLTLGKTILYANRCFARLLRQPLEQVLGSSFRQYLLPEDRMILRGHLRKHSRAGVKFQLQLRCGDGTMVPVQISLRSLGKNGSLQAIVGLVVTDLTEVRRTEERLRALARRVVQVQETERSRVALELHDSITQPLCAVLFHSQALADSLATRDGPAKRQAMMLCALLGRTAEKVERITQELRPGVLDELGLDGALRETSTGFENRTGVAVKLANENLAERLPAGTELALYRILQEALKNVEQHAGARHVEVSLRRLEGFVEMSVNDDGAGFPRRLSPGRSTSRGDLGLLGMRERAAGVGGFLTVDSIRGAGTRVLVRIPQGADS